MSIRRRMLKAAGRAEILLKDRVVPVVDFIKDKLNEEGGFQDRAGRSDLYYTVFGIESLLALEEELPRDKITGYLAKFGQGQSLDLVHLACLVRCWADISYPARPGIHSNIARRIANLLEQNPTIYKCFLALCACQDLSVETYDKKNFLDCIASLRTADGGYANQADIKVAATPSTAAAVTILHHLNEPVPEQAIDRLFSCVSPKGGFCVMPEVGPPDLLSTATAIHALFEAGAPLLEIKEQCLDFIDDLWDPQGGFCASSADRTADCEYTYYALLAMGHLIQ